MNILGAALGFFGDNGKFWGSTHMISGISSPGLGYATPSPDLTNMKKLDRGILNFNRMNRAKMSYTNTGWLMNNNYFSGLCDYSNATTIQMSNWYDMAVNGGTGKSRWNNPEIKYGAPVKAAFMIGANHTNQHGDVLFNMNMVNEKDSNGDYKLKLMISLDFFMTPTAQFAGYALSAASPLEYEGYTSQNSANYYMPKLIDPPGGAMQDIDIMARILNSYELGLEDKTITGGKSTAQPTK